MVLNVLLRLLLCLSCSLASLCSAKAFDPDSAPIRFLLTFDDGPSGSDFANPTAQVLDTLANNPIQNNIKAIFFVQTRANRSGATATGQALLRREFAEGHVLGLHTATPHHSNHRHLNPIELNQSLQNGVADLTQITGAAPHFVRPPFWSYDARTQAAYQQHGMQMLLTDLTAIDGKIWGVNFSMTKHRNLYQQLAALRVRWQAGELPAVDGATPIVVTLHDLNRYTALVLNDYLQILQDITQELNIPTAQPLFYDHRVAIEQAASASALQHRQIRPQALSGFWNWLEQ